MAEWLVADVEAEGEAIEFTRTTSVRWQRLRSLPRGNLEESVHQVLLEVLHQHEKRSQLVIIDAAQERLQR